jgi:hypothetical protein
LLVAATTSASNQLTTTPTTKSTTLKKIKIRKNKKSSNLATSNTKSKDQEEFDYIDEQDQPKTLNINCNYKSSVSLLNNESSYLLSGSHQQHFIKNDETRNKSTNETNKNELYDMIEKIQGDRLDNQRCEFINNNNNNLINNNNQDYSVCIFYYDIFFMTL